MGEASKILRSSIHAFLHGYPHFTSVAALLVLPVSASFLLSQSLIISSPYTTLHLISSRFRSLFHAAAFPSSSPLFSLLNLMLSQTIFSSIFTLPFTLTFLLLAKASIIQTLRDSPKNSLLNLYFPILQTYLFNSFLILSANATIFTLLFLLFTAAELTGLSSNNSLLLVMSLAGAVVYSVVIANTTVACNLAIVVSAMEKCSGCLPVLRAFMLIRGRVATALSIALPTNLALAGIEALFQYRVMRAYHLSSGFRVSIVGEAFTIAYMHAVVIVVEIISSWFFYRSCKLSCRENWDEDWCGCRVELEPEDKGLV